MPEVKVSHPVQVVAADRLGGVPRRPGRPGEAIADLLNAAGHVLAYLDGHGRCGAWTYDSAAQVIACTCGGMAFAIEEVPSQS